MEEEGGNALKELYLRRFYSGSRPRNTLEKVISFQQKLNDFKVAKNPLATHVALPNNQLLEEDTNRFRPTTNHSAHHPHALARTHRHTHDTKRVEGPALAELRLILDRRDASQDVLLEGRTEKGLYTAQGSRNRGRLLSHREISNRQEGSEPDERISKINMTSFLQERKLTSSEKKTRPPLYTKKENVSVKENAHDYDQTHKTVSKKVFIGGRDLEKAAEEYFKHYRQNSKKIETTQAARREKMSLPISERRVIEKNRSRGYKRSKVIIPNQKNKNGPRTEPKLPKYDDTIINLELDPWNVDADYF